MRRRASFPEPPIVPMAVCIAVIVVCLTVAQSMGISVAQFFGFGP